MDISERMSRWTAERSTTDAMDLLAEARIPCGEVLTPAKALVNEQVVARRFLEPVDYPGLPHPAPVGRMPVDFSKSDTGVRLRAPTLGEHTDEILGELGYDTAKIADFRSRRVI